VGSENGHTGAAMSSTTPSREEILRWRDWFVAQDLPTLRKAQEQIKLGTITDLCTCGCRSFHLTYDPDIAIEPVAARRTVGPFCEVAFASNAEAEINIMVSADENGMIPFMEIMISAANIPWPDFQVIPGDLIGVWEIQ
jgi:hypothetical protein